MQMYTHKYIYYKIKTKINSLKNDLNIEVQTFSLSGSSPACFCLITKSTVQVTLEQCRD